MSKKPFYLFVINNHAGHGKIDWMKEIEIFFQSKDIAYDYLILPKKIVPNRIQEKIKKHNPQIIVAVGGDGTVGLVAEIAITSNIKMGILPAGSANGMALEVGIPSAPQEALEILAQGTARTCDSIRINKKYRCLHLSDIGMNAQLIKYFDEGKLRGKWGYIRMIFKTMLRRKKMQVHFKTCEAIINSEAVMLVIANASKYGTGAVINPGAAFNDGLFELVLVRKLSFRSLLTMLLKPGPFNPKHIEIFRCESVEIKTKSSVHFQIDGEYLGKIKHIEAEIEPHVLQLILPASNN